jgi:hypothetical protein
VFSLQKSTERILYLFLNATTGAFFVAIRLHNLLYRMGLDENPAPFLIQYPLNNLKAI